MTTIAEPHCDCADCRAIHWAEAPSVTFTAHEVTDAWECGRDYGEQSTVRRLITTLTDWLKTDPNDPSQWLTDDRPSRSPEDDQ